MTDLLGFPMGTTSVPFRSEADIQRRAEGLLREHDAWYVPVDPIKLARAHGIRVYNATFDDDSISGILARRGPNITMLINANDHAFRKRFTIAHELGHYVLDHYTDEADHTDQHIDLYRTGGEPVLSTEAPAGRPASRPEEVQANLFASALLTPAELVRDRFEETNDVDQLARIFQVSPEAMGIKLGRLGLI